MGNGIWLWKMPHGNVIIYRGEGFVRMSVIVENCRLHTSISMILQTKFQSTAVSVHE